MSRSRVAATGMLALAFALGGLAGGAATTLADRTGNRHRDPYSPQSYAERLSTELALDPEQQRAVAAILQEHQPHMDSIWTTVRERFTAERQATRRDIRAVLNPEQIERYGALVARFDSVRQARGKRHGRH